MNGPKIYLQINGQNIITQTTVSSFVVMVLLCAAGYFLGRNLKKRPGKMQVITEKGVTTIYGLVEDTMGKHNSYWTPYIGALFLSSLGGSFIGMTGIFRSTTSDISTTLTWALMTSFLVWGCTIKNSGLKTFLKGYINPMNIISDIAQPVSMAFRHFGNIMGGSVLTSLLYTALAAASAAILGLIRSSGIAVIAIVAVLGIAAFFFGRKKKKLALKILGIALFAIAVCAALEYFGAFKEIPILEVGIPGVLSLYFDVFSGFVQALVFSLLTMVYVGMACPPKEEK